MATARNCKLTFLMSAPLPPKLTFSLFCSTLSLPISAISDSTPAILCPSSRSAIVISVAPYAALADRDCCRVSRNEDGASFSLTWAPDSSSASRTSTLATVRFPERTRLLPHSCDTSLSPSPLPLFTGARSRERPPGGSSLQVRGECAVPVRCISNQSGEVVGRISSRMHFLEWRWVRHGVRPSSFPCSSFGCCSWPQQGGCSFNRSQPIWAS